jgi:hypothetical protein
MKSLVRTAVLAVVLIVTNVVVVAAASACPIWFPYD